MGTSDVVKVALEFVDQVTDLDDNAAICDLLLKHTRALGFDNLVVTELPLGGRTPDVPLCTWPRSFFDLYCRQLYQDDPLSRHARVTTEPFMWSEVNWDRSRGSREQRVMDEAAAVGLENGFVVPIIGARGDQSAIGLAGKRARLNGADRRGLHLMCVFAHYAVHRRRAAVLRRSPPAALTPEQRDCLVQAALGRTAEEMSSRLRRTVGEIREACRSAVQALGTRNLMEAACVALLRRDIST